MGKLLIIEFTDSEQDIFQETLQYLSEKLCTEPFVLKSTHANLKIDPFKRIVRNFKGEVIYLTAKEFDLLYFLYSHKGQVFSKEQLYEYVWGFENIPLNTSNLPSFIRKLRKKIEPNPDNPIYIITVWGVGYKFNEEKP